MDLGLRGKRALVTGSSAGMRCGIDSLDVKVLTRQERARRRGRGGRRAGSLPRPQGKLN